MSNDKVLGEAIFLFTQDETEDLLKRLGALHAHIRTFKSEDAVMEAARISRPFLVIFSQTLPDYSNVIVRIAENLFSIPFISLRDAHQSDGTPLIKGKPIVSFTLPLGPSFTEHLAQVVSARILAAKQEEEELAFLTKTFTEETFDILHDIDPLLMKLEESPSGSNLIDLIYRKVHTVKGSAGVTPKAFELGKLFHEFESCLNELKKTKQAASPTAVNLFLATADLARTMIVALRDDTGISMQLQTSALQIREELGALRLSIPLKKVETEAAPPAARQAPAADAMESPGVEDEGVFVSNANLDSFIRLSGEFIVFKNYFDLYCRTSAASPPPPDEAKRSLKELAQEVTKLSGRLQDQIMEVRKVSLGHAFSKLPRLVRQTCQDLGKRAKLDQIGMDLGVDKTLAKALSGAMTHMVRNSLDHGMEPPAERVDLGKADQGSLVLTAMESKGIITVVLKDDGRGINKARVIAKAVSNGLISELESLRLSDKEIFQLLFLPGFSTAEKVTDVSGRGVGMDVVMSMVKSLHGSIDIQSREGVGTEIVIALPVPKTVVIEKTIIVQDGACYFAVPIAAIAKIDSIRAFPIVEMSGLLTCQFEGKTIRVGSFYDFANEGRPQKYARQEACSIVVLQHKNDRLGLIVEGIKSQMEAVVRPFDSIVRRVHGCKGTTALGASRIAYVISPEEFFAPTGSH